MHLEASKKKVQVTDKFLDGIFLGIQLFVWNAELLKDPVFFNSIRGTRRRLLLDDEPREPKKPGEQPLRIDVRLVHIDLPPPNNTEPAKQRRVKIRNSVELARSGYPPGCIGCEAAMIQGPSRGHTEQCRT